MSIIRAEVIQRMAKAFKDGLSASAFIRSMQAIGKAYRRTTMLADWRSVNQLTVKEGLARFIRSDRKPSSSVVAEVEWNMSTEYMYKFKVESRLGPQGDIESRWVNVMTDRLLTKEEAAGVLADLWSGYEQYGVEQLETANVWSIVHRAA